MNFSVRLTKLYSFKLVAIKLVTPGKAHLEKHYADLAGKPFFPGLIECMLPPARPWKN